MDTSGARKSRRWRSNRYMKEKEEEEEGGGRSSRRDEKKRKQMQRIMSKDTKWAIFCFKEKVANRWVVFPVQILSADEGSPSSSSSLRMNSASPPKVHHHGAEPLQTPYVYDFVTKYNGHHFSVAVIDSVMYILGGTNSRESKSVKMFDLLAPSKGEEISEQEGPDMLCARWCPIVLVLNKKLYVFGGYLSPDCPAFDPSKEGPWGEMYDPFTRRWCPIESPPGDYVSDMSTPIAYPHESFWATMHSPASIIFGSYKCPRNLILYKLNDSEVQWTERKITLPVLPDLFDSFGTGSAVAIGRTLLWFAPGNSLFVAFNLDLRVWFTEKSKSFLNSRFSDFTDLNVCLSVLHEGKDEEPSIVCLLFGLQDLSMDFDYDYSQEEPYSLHCLKFKVQIDPARKSIVSSLLDCQCTSLKVHLTTSFNLVSMG